MLVDLVRRRQGLTLMELVVVLVILVALAGVLVPLLPNILGRAHTSAGATNVAEINKHVQMYEQLYQSYPQNLDNLASSGALIDYLPNEGGPVGGQISTLTLNANTAAALKNAGLTSAANLYATKAALTAASGTPTFSPYDGTFTDLTTGAVVAQLAATAVEGKDGLIKVLPAQAGGTYVVFGLGKQSTMSGRVMTDAPTHFGESANTNAANVYGRFALVFRVATGDGAGGSVPLERAAFIGAVSLHPGGIAGVDGHLQEYYESVKQ